MGFRLDVRRLAAIDMWGSAGATWRRWVILVEFLLGVVGLGVLGTVALAQGDATQKVMGAWLVGVAVNYVPASVYAPFLIRPGALAAERDGVDIMGELRYYTVAQFCVAVPLLLTIVAILQSRRRSQPAIRRAASPPQ